MKDITCIKKIMIWLPAVIIIMIFIRDMRINEKLGTLLTLLMEQSWHPESVTVSWKKMERIEIKTIWMSITIL